ncbi:hypothetical protein Q427_03365 [Halomonas sp. BC04]|nr:hypothetical protein Q427_03365 [Halomonas sp. BC04]
MARLIKKMNTEVWKIFSPTIFLIKLPWAMTM